MSNEDDDRLRRLVSDKCDLIIACERAGPAKDGQCYTMRGIDMTSLGLIAPLHTIVDLSRTEAQPARFIAIGDGGNELGMGKVKDIVAAQIERGELIGAVHEADDLIAASVSNWGGYALAAAAAVVQHENETSTEAR